MTIDATPPPADRMNGERALVALRGVALRRAVLGVLLAASAPMSVADIVEEMRRAGATTRAGLARRPTQVVSDVVRYQRRLGRVRQLGRDRFEAVPQAMSAAMRSRCRHWRRALGGVAGASP